MRSPSTKNRTAFCCRDFRWQYASNTLANLVVGRTLKCTSVPSCASRRSRHRSIVVSQSSDARALSRVHRRRHHQRSPSSNENKSNQVISRLVARRRSSHHVPNFDVDVFLLHLLFHLFTHLVALASSAVVVVVVVVCRRSHEKNSTRPHSTARASDDATPRPRVDRPTEGETRTRRRPSVRPDRARRRRSSDRQT